MSTVPNVIQAQEPTAEVTAKKIARMTAEGIHIRWQVTAPYSGATLTVSTPEGDVIRKEFAARSSIQFSTIVEGEKLPDGPYSYELRCDVQPRESRLGLALRSCKRLSLKLSREMTRDT